MFLRKYGTGTGADVIIPIIKRGVVDFAVSADWTPASGDVKVSKDGGTEANIGTLPVINGTSGWKFVFSDAELQCKSLTVRIVDSATKAIEDQFFIVETYGNASAMFQSDLAAAQLTANVTHFGGSAGTFSDGRPEVNTTHAGGTAWGSGAITAASIASDAITAAKIASDAITAAKIASDAITAAKIADGAIDAATFAAGAINAAAIASNALAAAKFAADAVTLLQAGLATATALATAQTSLTTLEGRLTSARAGYFDNLNVGGAVASQADINALNQSASRRVILQSQGQYERPESGSSSYFIELRTYDGDGAATNADSNPSITITGAVTGSLAANLGVISNPSTGVYRWTYSQPSNAALEAIRIETSATIGGSAFPMSMMTQSVDFAAATWTTDDRTKLTAVYDKLPSRAYLSGTTSSSGAPLPGDLGLATANLDAQFDEMLADLATRESNIRGSDNDTLKTLSDQLDTKPTAVQVRQEMDTNSTVSIDLKQMISNDGTANAQWSTKALELAPTGGGGGGGGDATAANQTTIINHLTDIKGSGWSSTTDTLEKIRDAIPVSSTGTGARVVTITVNDGTTVLQNAVVRLAEGVNSFVTTTNASGVATFNLDDATYTVSISKSGYSYAGTTLVVDGTETVTYSMSQIAITPGTGDLTTGYFTALDDEGSPEADVSIYVEMTKVPSGDTGYAFDARVRTITSAANGLVTIEGLIKGATYRIYRGKWVDNKYLIPTTAGSTYELPSIIGREQ